MLKLIKNAVVISFIFALFNATEAQTRTSAVKLQTTVLLEQAIKTLNDGQTATAKNVLRQLLTRAPNNVEAHTLTGVIASQENDLRTAVKHFAIAAKLAANNPETRNNYGAILLRLNRKNEAAKEFSASLTLNPKQSSALINLAQIRFADNEWQASRELFERAEAIALEPQILQALVLISLQLNERERAAKEFNRYFETQKGNSDNPGNIDLQSQIALAEALLKADLLKEAQQQLELALNSKAKNVEVLILLSRVYLKQKDIKSAGRTLETAVKDNLDDARIYAALAEVYQAGGYLENAIPAMQLAIKKDQKNELYRARYGLLLINSKAPAAAEIRLSEAVKEFPESAKIWLTLGIAQQIDGKAAEAQNSFERALQLEPKSVQILAYLGNLAVEKAEYAKALEFYRRSLSIEEKNAVLHYLLADTMLQIPTSDRVEIEKHLKRAVEIDSQFAQAYLALGKIYVRANAWPEAVNAFEQATQRAPELAEAFYQLGRALARLKRNDESQIAFAQYKKLNEMQTAKKELDRRELVRRLSDVRF